MKKFIYILLATISLAGFYACSEDDLAGSHKQNNEIVVISQNVTFEAQASQGTITFSAPGAVSVTSSADWCHATVNGSTINVSVDENTDYNGRTAAITIAYGNETKVVPVQQNGIVILFDFADKRIECSNADNQFTFTGKSTDEITVTSNAEWLSGTYDGETLTVKVEKNTTTQKRTGYITLSAPKHDNACTITVVQEAAEKDASLTFEGTYTLEYKTSRTAADYTTPLTVTFTKSATDANVYNVTGVVENTVIPMVLNEDDKCFTIANTQVIGTSGANCIAVLVAYTNGSSNYVSYSQTASYAIYFDYTLDETTKKYTLTLRNSAPLFNAERTSTGFSVYEFSSSTTFSSDTRLTSKGGFYFPTFTQQ